MMGALLDATNAVTVLVDHNGLMRLKCRWIAAALYRGLLVNGVADSEAVTTLSAATGKHLAAVGGAHATAEAMLIGFLAVGGLECSFHFLSQFFSCSENFSQNAVQN
jgi:hypothetical protein